MRFLTRTRNKTPKAPPPPLPSIREILELALRDASEEALYGLRYAPLVQLNGTGRMAAAQRVRELTAALAALDEAEAQQTDRVR